MSGYGHRRIAHVERLDDTEFERVERELADRSGSLTRRGDTLVCSLPEGTHIMVAPETNGHRVEVRRASAAHWPVLGAAAACALVASVAWLTGAASFGYALLGGALSVAVTESLWDLFSRYRVRTTSRTVRAALRVRAVEVDVVEYEDIARARGRPVDE